jgi:hypothetical protein
MEMLFGQPTGFHNVAGQIQLFAPPYISECFSEGFRPVIGEMQIATAKIIGIAIGGPDDHRQSAGLGLGNRGTKILFITGLFKHVMALKQCWDCCARQALNPLQTLGKFKALIRRSYPRTKPKRPTMVKRTSTPRPIAMAAP